MRIFIEIYPVMFYLLPRFWGTERHKRLGAQMAMTSRGLKFPLFLASSALLAVYAMAAIGLLQRL